MSFIEMEIILIVLMVIFFRQMHILDNLWMVDALLLL